MHRCTDSLKTECLRNHSNSGRSIENNKHCNTIDNVHIIRISYFADTLLGWEMAVGLEGGLADESYQTHANDCCNWTTAPSCTSMYIPDFGTYNTENGRKVGIICSRSFTELTRHVTAIVNSLYPVLRWRAKKNAKWIRCSMLMHNKPSVHNNNNNNKASIS